MCAVWGDGNVMNSDPNWDCLSGVEYGSCFLDGRNRIWFVFSSFFSRGFDKEVKYYSLTSCGFFLESKQPEKA